MTDTENEERQEQQRQTNEVVFETVRDLDLYQSVRVGLHTTAPSFENTEVSGHVSHIKCGGDRTAEWYYVDVVTDDVPDEYTHGRLDFARKRGQSPTVHFRAVRRTDTTELRTTLGTVESIDVTGRTEFSEPDETVVTDGGSKYTVPTGDGYLGVYKTCHTSVAISIGATEGIEWRSNDDVFAIKEDGMVALAEGNPTDPIARAKVRKTGVGTSVRVPSSALKKVEGFEPDCDIRVYAREEGGMYVVAADADPFLATDGGQNIPTHDDLVDEHGDAKVDSVEGEFISSAEHILYDDQPDPDPGWENRCAECGDEAYHHHCGCCGLPLCNKHSELGAGFCSNFTTIVDDVPACVSETSVTVGAHLGGAEDVQVFETANPDAEVNYIHLPGDDGALCDEEVERIRAATLYDIRHEADDLCPLCENAILADGEGE